MHCKHTRLSKKYELSDMSIMACNCMLGGLILTHIGSILTMQNGLKTHTFYPRYASCQKCQIWHVIACWEVSFDSYLASVEMA